MLKWAALPNLAFDILGPLLAKAMSIVWVGKVFYMLAGALNLTGAVAITYALRRKPTAMMLVPAALLYNTVFVWGFLNYLFGAGLALWAFALWIMLRNSKAPIRCAVFVPLCLAIFFCHLVAFGVFVLCAGLFEIGFLFGSESRKEVRWSNFAVIAAASAIPAYLYLFKSPITQSHVSFTNPLVVKLRQLAYFFASGDVHAQSKVCFAIILLLALAFVFSPPIARPENSSSCRGAAGSLHRLPKHASRIGVPRSAAPHAPFVPVLQRLHRHRSAR